MKRTAEEHLGFRRRVPSEDIEGLQYTISLLRGILADNIAHKAPFMEKSDSSSVSLSNKRAERSIYGDLDL